MGKGIVSRTSAAAGSAFSVRFQQSLGGEKREGGEKKMGTGRGKKGNMKNTIEFTPEELRPRLLIFRQFRSSRRGGKEKKQSGGRRKK